MYISLRHCPENISIGFVIDWTDGFYFCIRFLSLCFDVMFTKPGESISFVGYRFFSFHVAKNGFISNTSQD